MNSNIRLQLATIFNVEDIRKYVDNPKEKNQSQRVFGKQLTNSLIFNNRKGLSRSINPVKQQKNLPKLKIKESLVATRRSFVANSLNTSIDYRLPQHIQNINEYSDNIYDFMLQKQQEHKLDENYMKDQKQINDKMRATLMDWLVDVHCKFRLLPQTLFKTIYIIDKYLEKNQISKKKLQLVGIAALFCSCKYQEIYPPSPKSFVELSQRTFSFSQIIDMEGKILKNCDFKLTFTTSLAFLQYYILIHKLSEKQSNMCRYLLQLSLLEIKMLKFNPSTLAAAVIFLTNYICKVNIKINYTGLKLNENQIKISAKELCLLFQKIPKASTQASRKKYASSTFSEVSKIILQANNQL